MRTLKFKAQPTTAFFTTINQMFADSSQIPIAAESAVIKIVVHSSDNEQSLAVVVSWEDPPNIWLTAAKNAFVGRTFNFRVRMLLKSAVNISIQGKGNKDCLKTSGWLPRKDPASTQQSAWSHQRDTQSPSRSYVWCYGQTWWVRCRRFNPHACAWEVSSRSWQREGSVGCCEASFEASKLPQFPWSESCFWILWQGKDGLLKGMCGKKQVKTLGKH